MYVLIFLSFTLFLVYLYLGRKELVTNLFIMQEEKYCERAEKLKEEVRKMLEKTMTNSLEQLELIDILQRLGIYYHFEEEIDRVLKQIYVNYNKRDHHNEDYLYATALKFRLLRQQGYHVPQGTSNFPIFF